MYTNNSEGSISNHSSGGGGDVRAFTTSGTSAGPRRRPGAAWRASLPRWCSPAASSSSRTSSQTAGTHPDPGTTPATCAPPSEVGSAPWNLLKLQLKCKLRVTKLGYSCIDCKNICLPPVGNRGLPVTNCRNKRCSSRLYDASISMSMRIARDSALYPWSGRIHSVSIRGSQRWSRPPVEKIFNVTFIFFTSTTIFQSYAVHLYVVSIDNLPDGLPQNTCSNSSG